MYILDAPDCSFRLNTIVHIVHCTRNTGTAVNPFNRRLTEHVCGGGGCLSRSGGGWRGAGGVVEVSVTSTTRAAAAL